MGKVNSYSKEKNIGKHKHFKVKGFLFFWLVEEIHGVTKIGKSMGNTKTSNLLVLKYSRGTETHTIPIIWEK